MSSLLVYDMTNSKYPYDPGTAPNCCWNCHFSEHFMTDQYRCVSKDKKALYYGQKYIWDLYSKVDCPAFQAMSVKEKYGFPREE